MSARIWDNRIIKVKFLKAEYDSSADTPAGPLNAD